MIKDIIIYKILIMLKKISDLGTSLSNNEQKKIQGGIFDALDGGAGFPCNCDDGRSTTTDTIQECWDFCC
jgi:hypothetical protein